MIERFMKETKSSVEIKLAASIFSWISIGGEKKILCINISDKLKFFFANRRMDVTFLNTEAILQEKLLYWSKKTNITYNSVKVRDAKTKYGSCTPKTKALHFSSRLVMLKEEAIDAIIVHELCHIVHPNHSKYFYNLVETYIPNYKEIDKYLKENSKLITI